MKDNLYGPKVRNHFSQKPMRILSMSQTGNTYSELPDPVLDPIVSNNISYSEFDYTDSISYDNESLIKD